MSLDVVPPIVSNDSGDVTVFASVDAAETFHESLDISVLDFFDATGLKLSATPAPNGGLELHVAEPRELDPAGLTLLVRRFLIAVGPDLTNVGQPESLDLSSLIAALEAFQGVEHT